MAIADDQAKFDNRIVLAKCCVADKAYKLLLEEMNGEVCKCKWESLFYQIEALSMLECYLLTGAVETEAKSARATIQQRTAINGYTYLITIKDALNNIIFSANTVCTTNNPAITMRQLADEVNDKFAINQTFTAQYGVSFDGTYDPQCVTVYAVPGAYANQYIFTYISSDPYLADNKMKHGQNAVLRTSNLLSSAQIDAMFEKIEELCEGCACDKTDEEILDDTIDSSLTE